MDVGGEGEGTTEGRVLREVVPPTNMMKARYVIIRFLVPLFLSASLSSSSLSIAVVRTLFSPYG